MHMLWPETYLVLDMFVLQIGFELHFITDELIAYGRWAPFEQFSLKLATLL